jgi:CRP-like cAMP-binding protein
MRPRTISVDCTGDGVVRIRPGALHAYPDFAPAADEQLCGEPDGSAPDESPSLGESEPAPVSREEVPQECDGADDGTSSSRPPSSASGLPEGAAVSAAGEGCGEPQTPSLPPSAESLMSLRGTKAANSLPAPGTPDRVAQRSSYWKARHCSAGPPPRSSLSWPSQDLATEQEILAGVDPANLSPSQKAYRCEKATLLLYGYMSAAERESLRNPTTSNLFPSPSTASGMPTRDIPFAGRSVLVTDDTLLLSADDVAPLPNDPLDRFLACEDAVEVRRFRQERWCDKIVFCSSIVVLLSALRQHFARKTLREVLTPMVLFRVEVWKRKALNERVRLQRERSLAELQIRRPTWQFLKNYSQLFLDWPQKCLEELCDCLVLQFCPAGSAVYFAGDVGNRDMFFVGRGNLEAVYFTPGRDPQRPKSRRRSNGVVVDSYNTGDLFGQAMLLTGEPRTTSVFATVDTDIFRVPHRGFVAAAAGVAEITYALMKSLQIMERHEQLLRVYPIDVEAVRRCNDIIADWPLHVVHELVNTRLVRTLRKKGEQLWRLGDRSMSDAFLVVTGSVLLEPPVDGKSLVTANEFVGLEELLVPGECRPYTATVLTSSDIFVLNRESGFLPVLRANAECGVSCRARAGARLAARLDPRPPMPRAVVIDVPFNYMLTPELFSAMWSLATPFAALQGDELFFDFTPADTIYVITSGAIFERHSSNGGLSAGLPDPAVMLQRQVVIGSNNALVRRAPAVTTWFGGGLDELHGFISLADAFYIAQKTADEAKTSSASESFEEALVLGSLETAMQRQTYISSVRCLSVCSGYAVSRPKLEKLLMLESPLLYSALTHELSVKAVQRHFAAGQLHHILQEATPRSAAVRT